MPEATSDTDTTDDTGGDTPTEPDHAAEATKWKELARKHEDRAKANAAAAKELDELRKQTMNDQEKAVAEAVATARSKAITELGGEIVAAEVRAAAAGRGIDVDALIDGVNVAKFIDENGRPDRDEIKAWVDRVAPAASEDTGTRTANPLDLGQGIGGTSPASSDPLKAELTKALGL